MKIIYLIALTLFLCGIAIGDSYDAVHPLVAMDRYGKYLAKVVEDSDVNKKAKVFIYRIEPTEKFKLIRKFYLDDGDMPNVIALSLSGGLVTIDKWRVRGKGSVVTIYNANGLVVKKYTLQDIYQEEHFPRSSSSVFWRCGSIAPYITPSNKLEIFDKGGGKLVFDLETGKMTYTLLKNFSCP